jgi:hypothetical protein
MEFRDQIGHEISSLSTFVDSVAAPCVRVSRSEAFIDSSERFFQYISLLAIHTQGYLGNLSLDSMTGDDFDSNRQQLKTIRDAWRDLHPFIKPATNADTLSMPLALLQSLVRRVREIEGFGGVDFVIFHTDEFNYLQVNPTRFRLVVNKVALTLGAREFESDLGLIGMPSSQSSGLFMNCLLAHEIGHFAYDRKSLLGFIKAEAEAAVKLEDKGRAKSTERNAMVEVVAQWAEELFCDLFAVMLIGPCYTFSYIEFFDIVNLLSREDGLCEPKLVERLPFYPEHPSHIFRVQQQSQLLKSTGWWHQIKSGESRHIRLMEHLLTIDLERYPSSDPRREIPIRAFIRILPEINKAVGDVAGKLDSCVHDYGLVHHHVREYLRNGVVPSTLNIKTGASVAKVHPTDLAAINSAFMFYLEEIGTLLKTFSGPSVPDIQRRNHWIRKVESWAVKALGDLQLITEPK